MINLFFRWLGADWLNSGLFLAVPVGMSEAHVFSEKSAEQIVEYLSTAVLVFNTQLQLVFVNGAGEMMFAHSSRHLCGRSVHELLVNSEAMVAQLAAAITSEQVVIQRGCLLELPDANDLRVNCTFTPIREAGGIDRVLVELRQVDHHLRIEQEEHLINQQQATHALVRGLAHEIKNPLGGLRGAAQLLEREVHDESLKEYTQIIISEADRLQALIDRMLGPNTVPQLQAVNVHEILEHVRELVLVESGDGLTIDTDYDPSLPDLKADPDLLIQALLNVVRNAAQALQGEGTIRLRTRVQRNFNIGSRRHRLVACIEVIDNGHGIDEVLQKQVFYPMVTGRSDGTGLGLSIAQALISRHQGLIECSSNPGETVFTILLPLDVKV